jgi:hypothetical protein
MHLKRWYRHGDSLYERPAPLPKPPGLHSLTIAQRLFQRVEITDTCWLWAGSKTPRGYGHMSWRHELLYTHRIAYELCVGPIPDDFTIDHRCCNPPCCRPDHLDAVRLRVNILRSPTALAAINARKTHCKRDHEFTEDNTYRDAKHPNKRKCRACHLALLRRRRKARQAVHQLRPS